MNPNQTHYSKLVEELFTSQMEQWPLMKINYGALGQIRLKQLDFPGFFMNVQFNPARIVSSSAKVDKTSIEKRPCFLCAQNRPSEQESVSFHKQFDILVNPFPIFPKHLTIAHQHHIPQGIQGHIGAMLELARELPGYTIFYNGPRCGASAPDHFHFQAGTKNYMPLDFQIANMIRTFGNLRLHNNCSVWKIDDMIRKFVVIESHDAIAAEQVFEKLFHQLYRLKPVVDEPDLNLHCLYDENRWRLVLFPRAAHRPWQYFAEDEENILFSPASVDLGGCLIVPLEKDFEKLDRVAAWSMIKQVSLNSKQFDELVI
jgi:ATP adenylyltransferase/5',5'''-P-1,P-4-tetraphosphate phosphorylase II